MPRFIVFDHVQPTRAIPWGSPWLAVAALGLGGCAGPLSTLDPAGPAARDVAEIWWVMFAGALVILAGVMGAVLVSLRRGGRDVPKNLMLVGGGLVFPVLVMGLLLGWALFRGEHLLARGANQMPVIHAHAVRFGWEFRYPDAGLTTLNVLHVPAGQPFQVRVTSADVIHAFWVPRLGGKIDAVPGKTNRIVLAADAPGTYAGLCAEYCGVGHAHMNFLVRAHAAGDYDAALAASGAAAAPPLVFHDDRPPPVSRQIRAAYENVLRWLGVAP
ncbi:cytochrome c oxidase subunit II [Iodidimonas sp. SYSU 1G8]|uniref:cytochrome c oxidase subunit II n=1 Tax=Iodidimonas sp. SYSU 1G8 TaxID=3133967 RepID=UPI0031FEB011